MAGIFLNLPWPTSTNRIWRKGGRFGIKKSDEYKAFQARVNDYVLEHRVPRHWTEDKLAVGMVCYPPSRVVTDIDNRIKATLDSMQGAGVIVNDSRVELLVIARGAIVPGGGVHVRVEELSLLAAGLDVRAWFNMDGAVPYVGVGGARCPLSR